jgi:sugar O-acyltransferase (sialic acid O-acetyltransferase NeuD family)
MSNKMIRLAILGAGGHGRVVADIAETNGWKFIDFYDDNLTLKNAVIQSWTVVGNIDDLLSSWSKYDGVFVAIGDNRQRKDKIEMFRNADANLINLIHSTASISRYSSIGSAVVIMAGAVINTGVIIGSGSIINTNASVDHDCFLGESVHVSPGACLGGGVKVGSCSWLGIGSSVKQNIVLGSDVIVGAGAAVVSNFADGSIVVGVPAKKIKHVAHKTNLDIL